MIRIPKRFTGHAAHVLRSLLRGYKPPSKLDIMAKVYDPADDGPEIDIIKFFERHPKGYRNGFKMCLHIKGRICDFR